ncbi:kelch-like protein 20 [Rhipicephalus sanguineus]|uniref:kelch-like protein 20 n=1 Tax=Rhipicephalus sanguineus TaxID=34632 RepID=UPI0020C2E00A|nr:kelch-like protein 20 [Rhipicephalus sanguineus]
MNAADGPAAGEPGNADIITIWSEAENLFKDTGERRDFAPGAAARSMPALREQRKNRDFCDVVFRAPDGSEIWAHRFVVAARYSGCYALFALAKKGLSPEQKWLPPMRVTVDDLSSEMIQLLVDVAYRIPLCDLVGQHNIAEVLELAEKLELSQLLNHCVNFLKHDLQPESCIDNYHLASSRGYNYLASEVFRYLIRNFDQYTPSCSAGGYTGFSVLDTVEFYDPSTDVWTHMQSMPWRRSGHKLLAYGDMIYIIGGSNGVARVSTLQQLDVQKHRYSELPSMPHAKSNFAAAILEGCIYIIGGFNGGADSKLDFARALITAGYPLQWPE